MKRNSTGRPTGTPLRKDILLTAAACLAAALCVAPSLSGDFLNWDDDRFVVNNPKVSSLSIENIADAFLGIRFESYQPLHLVSYMVDGSLMPGSAPFYRVHNLLLYLGSIVLLYSLLRRLKFPSGAAFAGCLIFAVAPYRIESVAWITGRKDVLMLLFLLSAWHVHLTADEAARRKPLYRGLAVSLFALAMLSKSAATVFPAMVFLVDLGIQKKRLRSALLHALPYAPFSIASAVVLPRIWSDASLIHPTAEVVAPPWILAGWTFLHYVKTVLWPFHLSPIYAVPSAETIVREAIIGHALLCIIFSTVVYKLVKRRTLGPFDVSFGVFFVSLLPFLNIIPLYYYRADRYLLLPSLGLSIGAASLMMQAAGRKRTMSRLVPVLVFGFAALMGGAAMLESTAWHDSLSLWRWAVRKEPDAFFARMKLGETLRNAEMPEASTREYKAALAIKPLSPSALGGLFWGSLLQDMNETGPKDKAVAEKLAYTFVSIANDGAKLEALSRYLKQRGWRRAAAVTDARLKPPARGPWQN